ncbi:MAG: cupin domain-containing protein [Pseudomonadota bacterium]
MDYSDHIDGFAEAPIAIDAAGIAEEGWADPEHGGVSWRSLIDARRTPSKGLTQGIMSLAPFTRLAPHRHTPAEIYFCLEGDGTLTIDGVDYALYPGVTVYVPSDAEHSTGAGADGVKVLYTFPTDSLANVDYRFSS